MARIQLSDQVKDAVAKMSDGNPGAMGVMMEMLTKGKTIDPEDLMQGLGSILMLDTLGIYGSDIYVLHNDICGRNLAKTIAVIHSTQLGFFSGPLLASACHRQDYSGRELVPVDDLYLKVKERLPNFDTEAATT